MSKDDVTIAQHLTAIRDALDEFAAVVPGDKLVLDLGADEVNDAIDRLCSLTNAVEALNDEVSERNDEIEERAWMAEPVTWL